MEYYYDKHQRAWINMSVYSSDKDKLCDWVMCDKLRHAKQNNLFLITKNPYPGVDTKYTYIDVSNFKFFVHRFKGVNKTELYVFCIADGIQSSCWLDTKDIVNFDKLMTVKALVPDYSEVVRYVEQTNGSYDIRDTEETVYNKMKRAYESLPPEGQLLYSSEGKYSF